MLSDGFFDPHKPVTIRWGDLPHWRQDGATYFVTFRLGDSLPDGLMGQWRRERELWRQQNPSPSAEDLEQFARRHRGRMERWLDQGHGCSVLANEAAARLACGALQFFDGSRYELGEHAVAPNHVHAVARVVPGLDLSDVLASWKRFISREVGAIPALRARGPASGFPFWQKESFDHIVRNAESLDRINNYIRSHKSGGGL